MRNSKILKTTEQSWAKIMFYRKTSIKSTRFCSDFLFFLFLHSNERFISNDLQLKSRENVKCVNKNTEGCKTKFNKKCYIKVFNMLHYLLTNHLTLQRTAQNLH